MAYEPPDFIEPRNPWTDIDNWKEFLYDVRHPVLYCKRGWNAIKETLKWIGKGGWIYK